MLPLIYNQIQNIFGENNNANSTPLPNISQAAVAQSLVALNCYKSSPIHNCTCPKYMCTCLLKMLNAYSISHCREIVKIEQ